MMLCQFISFRATEFSGTTVGLAYMSTMCTPYHSVGIVQVCLEINSGSIGQVHQMLFFLYLLRR